LERVESRHDELLRKTGRHGQNENVIDISDVTDSMFEQGEGVVDGGSQGVARTRQGAAVRVPHEQFDTERLFEPLNLASDSWLRKTEFASGG
jgi:hypothetical protein